MDKTLLEKAIDAALEVRENSYSPYSGFKVGAALVTKSGKIYRGTNIENSSFGATVCAERTALFTAVADGEKEFDFIVVTATLKGNAVYPCGICRQVLADFSKNLKVYLLNSDTKKIEVETTLLELIPGVFEF